MAAVIASLNDNVVGVKLGAGRWASLRWRPTGDGEAEDVERDLVLEFQRRYERLPRANRV